MSPCHVELSTSALALGPVTCTRPPGCHSSVTSAYCGPSFLAWDILLPLCSTLKIQHFSTFLAGLPWLSVFPGLHALQTTSTSIMGCCKGCRAKSSHLFWKYWSMYEEGIKVDVSLVICQIIPLWTRHLVKGDLLGETLRNHLRTCLHHRLPIIVGSSDF